MILKTYRLVHLQTTFPSLFRLLAIYSGMGPPPVRWSGCGSGPVLFRSKYPLFALPIAFATSFLSSWLPWETRKIFLHENVPNRSLGETDTFTFFQKFREVSEVGAFVSGHKLSRNILPGMCIQFMHRNPVPVSMQEDGFPFLLISLDQPLHVSVRAI